MIYTPEDDHFIISNYGKMPYSEMSKYISTSPSRIQLRARCKRLGIQKHGSGNNRTWRSSEWTSEDDDVLKANYGLMSFIDIGKLLDKHYRAVNARAKYIGIAKDGKGRKFAEQNIDQTKYDVNHDYFSDPNPVSAYWAGFIAADGSIQSGNRNGLSFNLSSKDVEHLKLFCSSVGFAGPVVESHYKKHPIVSARLTSAKWKSDLSRHYNITERKTFTLKPPNLTDELLLKCFLAGYIDGDGCIYVGKKKSKHGVVAEHVRLSIITASHEMITWIAEMFGTMSGKHLRIYERNVVNKNYTCIATGFGAMSIIGSLSCLGLPLLDRKWSKVSSFLTHKEVGMTMAGRKKVCPIRKLNADDMEEIKVLHINGVMSTADIARKFNVTRTRIQQIRRRFKDEAGNRIPAII